MKKRFPGWIALTLALSMSCALPALAAGGAADSPSRQVIPFMLFIALILVAAKAGGEIFERIGQPAVLGELLSGVVLGNLGLVGIHGLDGLHTNEAVGVAAEVGAILLLFEVGLESRLEELAKVGLSSFLVACAGVIAPVLLGFAVGELMLSHEPRLVHAFLGATLAATSVGITARVMKDLGKTRSKEARIILGAAVIDDVLGLVILAVVSGLIAAAAHGGGGVSAGGVLIIVSKAAVFLAGAVGAGYWLARPLLATMAKMRVRGVLITASIALCFLLASISGLLGLAPIVGAFAAGLVLDPPVYHGYTRRGERPLEEQLRPVTDVFVPVFFVLMGLKVDLRSFADVHALGLAGALILAAVIGKMVCGWSTLEKHLNRMIVSVGMIPRGEVGLIFASIGGTLKVAGEPVISASTYSAVVMMVMVTTLITPVWLKTLFSRQDKRARSKVEAPAAD